MKSDATSSSLNYCFLYSELPFHFVFLSTKSSKVKLSFSAFVILQTRMTYNQQKILALLKYTQTTITRNGKYSTGYRKKRISLR